MMTTLGEDTFPPRGSIYMDMFRSVFAKYVTTFMALLTASFLLLLFIVNSVLSNDNRRAERKAMAEVGETCAKYVANLYEESGEQDFGDFIRRNTAEE
jgi:hypothetical protein